MIEFDTAALEERCVQPISEPTGLSGKPSASEETYWEWLCSIPELYLVHHQVLLRCFESPEAVWRASAGEYEALERQGCSWIRKVEQYRKEQEPFELVHILQQKGIQFISRSQSSYPERLRRIPDAPYGLFYRGRLPSEERRQVAVVGARMCTRYGKEMAQVVARAIISSGGELISGAAYGIDGIAQMEALHQGGVSFAVLGCGVDQIYPKSNHALFELLEKQGGILSELPPGTPPLRHHFPLRNRLISGLSDVVVVVEARKKSGSLITADYAADQGREVYAVPGRLGDELSEGCNELISQGAGIFLSPGQFCETVFAVPEGQKMENSIQQALAPSEKLVYSSLNLHSKSIFELQECTGLPLDELCTALLSLEQKGLGRETARNYYAKME